MNILYNERNVYGKGAYKLPLIHTNPHGLRIQNEKETYDFTVVLMQLKHRPFDIRSNIYRTHIAIIKSREEQENFAHLAFDCNIKMGSIFVVVQLAIDEKCIETMYANILYTCETKFGSFSLYAIRNVGRKCTENLLHYIKCNT